MSLSINDNNILGVISIKKIKKMKPIYFTNKSKKMINFISNSKPPSLEKNGDLNFNKFLFESHNLYEKTVEFSRDYLELYEHYLALSAENRNLKSKLNKTNNKLSKFSNKRKITDTDILKIKQLRNNGLSYREIEKEVGWSKYVIGKVLNDKYK